MNAKKRTAALVILVLTLLMPVASGAASDTVTIRVYMKVEPAPVIEPGDETIKKDAFYGMERLLTRPYFLSNVLRDGTGIIWRGY